MAFSRIARVLLFSLGVWLTWLLYGLILREGFIVRLHVDDPAVFWWAFKDRRPILWFFFMTVGSVGLYYALRGTFLHYLSAKVITRMLQAKEFRISPKQSLPYGGWGVLSQHLDMSLYGNLMGFSTATAILFYVRGAEVISLAHFGLSIFMIILTPWIGYVYYVRWFGPLAQAFTEARERAISEIVSGEVALESPKFGCIEVFLFTGLIQELKYLRKLHIERVRLAQVQALRELRLPESSSLNRLIQVTSLLVGGLGFVASCIAVWQFLSRS